MKKCTKSEKLQNLINAKRQKYDQPNIVIDTKRLRQYSMKKPKINKCRDLL